MPARAHLRMQQIVTPHSSATILAGTIVRSARIPTFLRLRGGEDAANSSDELSGPAHDRRIVRKKITASDYRYRLLDPLAPAFGAGFGKCRIENFRTQTVREIL